MDVLMCGHNGFNQLNCDVNNLETSDKYKLITTVTDDNHVGRSHVNPNISFSLSNTVNINIEDIDINVLFTWSRCVVSIKTETEKCVTLVTGFNSKEKTPSLVLENALCTAVADGSILLTEKDYPGRISVLHDGMAQSFSVSVRSDDNQTSSMKLRHVASGHKEIYSVYDDISFGKFSLSDVPTPSNSDGHKEEKRPADVSEIKVKICHIDFVIPIKEISCGKEHVLLLATSGNVYSCGLSSRGQLGHGEIEDESSPRLLDALDGLTMKTVKAGGWHSTAISDIGDLYVWGWNESGQLGLGSTKRGEGASDKGQDENIGIVALPACLDVPGGENVKDVACGSRHTVVLTETGKIYTCGWNGYGQLGVGDTSNRDMLTKVDGLTGHRVFAGHWNSAFVCKKDFVK